MENRSRVARRATSAGVVKNSPHIRIGVIADTHGLYDPVIERHFSDVAEILHAGDIGDQHVIQRLKQLAPVTAVSGNVDEYEKSGFPHRVVLRRGGVTIALCHVLYEKGKMTEEARTWLDREMSDICIFGHSHKPTRGEHGKTILFNPGSAGPKRFSLPRGIGVLTISKKRVLPRLIKLSDNVRGRESRNVVNRTRQKGGNL
jgi:putative phosphoesterase